MKKNGFSLLELLALIVLLSIIPLIAVPIVSNTIRNAEKNSFKNTAYGIIEAAELDYANDALKGIEEPITFIYDDSQEISIPSGKKLDIDGKNPKNGIVTINKMGDVAFAIHNGKYCATKQYNKKM